MREFESSGVWSSSTSPDADVVGLVSFSSEAGWKLTIPVGPLDPAESLSIGILTPRLPVIHGHLQNGKHVTLVDCIQTNCVIAMPGTVREEYAAALGFIGSLPCEADPQIYSAQVSYEHLRDWVGVRPAHFDPPTATARSDMRFGYRYETPDDVFLGTGNGFRIHLQHTVEYESPSVKGFRVNHDCRLSIEAIESVSFQRLAKTCLAPLGSFLSFCLDSGTNQMDLHVRLTDTDEWIEVGQQPAALSQGQEDVIVEPFMLLSLRQLGDRFESALGHWLNSDGDEVRATSLLAGLASKRTVPSDLRFLAAVQALEALARIDCRLQELQPHEYERRLALALAGVQDDTKVHKWAERKLRYANSRPFRDLVMDLVRLVGTYATLLAPDLERFVDDIRDNRNFLAHRDDTRVRSVLESGELYVLTQGVLCLCKAAVLRRLGFSDEETASIMRGCSACAQWTSRVAGQYGPALA